MKVTYVERIFICGSLAGSDIGNSVQYQLLWLVL